MEKEKSNPYTFFILRYRLVNLQGGIFAFEKEKDYGKKYLEQGFTFANWNLGFQFSRKTKSLQFTNNVTNVKMLKNKTN